MSSVHQAEVDVDATTEVFGCMNFWMYWKEYVNKVNTMDGIMVPLVEARGGCCLLCSIIVI